MISKTTNQAAGTFNGDERDLMPQGCEFWQMNRIPRSPLYPKTRYSRWLHTDSEENYNKRGNKEFTVESVGYDFNMLGYRSPEFQREPGELAVMFLGDSNTLGLGTPWEGLWTSHVVNHLEKRWGAPVRQLNLAWGGTGSDYTAMMLHQTIEVLQPEAVFILWSFVGRMTWFANARCQVHFIPEWMPDAYAKDHSAYLRLATEPHGFFNYVRNFHLVNDRLSRLEIPFYWGNLEQFSEEMLAPYLPLDGYAGRWKTIDLARDGRHGGLKSHAYFAKLVVSAIERDGLSPRIASPAETRFPIPITSTDLPVSPAARGKRRKSIHTLIRMVSGLIDQLRVARRIRAMKRKDPFIY
jgi:hypothetical protein